MARIRDTRGRSDGGSGYGRLLGVPRLGALISRVHATAIRNGNELESLLAERCPVRAHELGERLLQASFFNPPQPVEAYFRESIQTDTSDRPTVFDVVVIDRINRRSAVIEIKDGDEFDTKKSDGELESLQRVAEKLESTFGFPCRYYFCSFNQRDLSTIMRGTKQRFSRDQVMTGPQLCELLQVDYEEITRRRREDAEDNLRYFLNELADIEPVREQLDALLEREPSDTENLPRSENG